MAQNASFGTVTPDVERPASPDAGQWFTVRSLVLYRRSPTVRERNIKYHNGLVGPAICASWRQALSTKKLVKANSL